MDNRYIDVISFNQAIGLIVFDKKYKDKDIEWARYTLTRCLNNTNGPITKSLIWQVLEYEFDIKEN